MTEGKVNMFKNLTDVLNPFAKEIGYLLEIYSLRAVLSFTKHFARIAVKYSKFLILRADFCRRFSKIFKSYLKKKIVYSCNAALHCRSKFVFKFFIKSTNVINIYRTKLGLFHGI